MKRRIIIYLPNGNELKFSTVDLMYSAYRIVEHISFSLIDTHAHSVSIKEKDIDGTKSFTTYVGLPFQVESWD